MAKRFNSAFAAEPGPRETVAFSLPSRTNQDFKDESDIAALVARHRATGFYYDPLTGARAKPRQPMIGDFSEGVDFAAAQEVIRKGNESFASVPAFIRRMFDDDPALFVGIVSNPDKVKAFAASGEAQAAAMRQLGLLPTETKSPETPPAPVNPES